MQFSAHLFLGLAVAALGASGLARADAPERIVFVRHGEKPAGGFGQLDCQGLNRALRLPAFFAKAFGKPDAIFAPDPATQKKDSGTLYDYVRPLATIEPTAIAFGMPVDTHFGFADVKGLESALQSREYAHALVFVAWEHRLIDVVVRDILKSHGADPAQAPAWNETDFDGVDVVTLQDGRASFSRTKEGLDGQPETCAR